MLGHEFPEYHAALKRFRDEQTRTVLDNPDPRQP